MMKRVEPSLRLARAIAEDQSPEGAILADAMQRVIIEVLRGRKNLSPEVRKEMQRALLELTPRGNQ